MPWRIECGLVNNSLPDWVPVLARVRWSIAFCQHIWNYLTKPSFIIPSITQMQLVQLQTWVLNSQRIFHERSEKYAESFNYASCFYQRTRWPRKATSPIFKSAQNFTLLASMPLLPFQPLNRVLPIREKFSSSDIASMFYFFLNWMYH